jgi:TRAP transporter TAXI family solute receptor
MRAVPSVIRRLVPPRLLRPVLDPLRVRQGVVFVGLTVALVAGLGGWAVAGRGPDYPRGTVEIATGGTQGVYYSYGVELARVVEAELDGVDADVRPTAGSVANLQRVAVRYDTVAFSAADAATDAISGSAPFDRRLPVRAIGRVYDDYVHLVVPVTSPVRRADQLRGLRVSLGSVGSGTELIAARLLSLLHLDPASDLRAAHLGINESVAALSAGKIDAFFWSGGLPTAGVAALARRTPIRLVPLGQYAEQMRDRFSPTYRAAAIPDGTYPGTTGTLTIAVPNYLVTSVEADERLVYQITRLLFASRERLARRVPLAGVLDERVAIETVPVPLHPGALRYYRDRKR